MKKRRKFFKTDDINMWKRCLTKHVVMVVVADTLNKAVSVKYYTHCLQLFLFPHPSVKVHLIDFVKSLLVKDTLIPEFIKMLVHLLGIIMAQNFLDFTKLISTFVTLKHPKQMQLNGVKYGSFHNLSFSISPLQS